MKNIYIILILLLSTLNGFSSNAETIKRTVVPVDENACLPVDFFYATNITINSADIGWNPSPEAIQYIVTYKRLDDTAWLAVSVAFDSLASIYDLDTCKPYEFYITAICSDFTELESPRDTFFTLCDTISNAILSNFQYENVVLYPNPTTGEINIRLDEPVFGDVIIRIYNSAGTLQDEKTYILNGEDELKNIAFLKWAEGLNFVSISFNNQLKVKQVLVYR